VFRQTIPDVVLLGDFLRIAAKIPRKIDSEKPNHPINQSKQIPPYVNMTDATPKKRVVKTLKTKSFRLFDFNIYDEFPSKVLNHENNSGSEPDSGNEAFGSTRENEGRIVLIRTIIDVPRRPVNS
jgi:hypothetical protein